MKPHIQRFIKNYVPGKGAAYFWGVFFLLLTIAATTAVPSFLKKGINVLENAAGGLTPAQSHELFQVALVIICLGVFLALFRVLSRIIIFHPGRKIESEIRQDYFKALTALRPEDIRGYEMGDLISRGTNDVTSVRIMISMGILHSINCILTVSICFFQMYHISGKLTLFCLLPAPVILIAVRKLSVIMMDKARQMQESLGKLSERIREFLGAHRLMGVFDIFEPLFQRFSVENKRYSEVLQAHVRVRTVLFLVSANLSQIASFILLFFGAREVMAGRLDLGSFAAFSSYLGILQEPLRSGGFLISIIQRGEICLKRIFEFMDLADAAEKKQKDKKYQTGLQLNQNTQSEAPLISIHNLVFPEKTFPKKDSEQQPFQLRIHSLQLRSGKKYGFFGPTGSGKSLLLNLLTGNTDTARGVLAFRGVDYADIASAALRSQFSIVPQENRHFSRTIRENVTQVQNQKAKDLEAFTKQYDFDTALDISLLEPDVEQFPEKLDTLLGEHGINLSGGQKQRLSLFRALMKPHQILILDDLVSSVDHPTENEILKRLYANLTPTDTVLFVSHRISALVPCDTIFVLEGGRIVAQGNHETLLKEYAPYRNTYKHQMLEAEIET